MIYLHIKFLKKYMPINWRPDKKSYIDISRTVFYIIHKESGLNRSYSS
jgi:hypothetical protein